MRSHIATGSQSGVFLQRAHKRAHLSWEENMTLKVAAAFLFALAGVAGAQDQRLNPAGLPGMCLLYCPPVCTFQSGPGGSCSCDCSNEGLSDLFAVDPAAELKMIRGSISLNLDYDSAKR